MERQTNTNLTQTNRLIGLLLLVVGIVLLMRQAGYPFPRWLFNWEVILIIFGLLLGLRNGFRDLTSLILIMIGLVFLSDDIWPDFRVRQYAIPLIVIAIGLKLILLPGRMPRSDPQHKVGPDNRRVPPDQQRTP